MGPPQPGAPYRSVLACPSLEEHPIPSCGGELGVAGLCDPAHKPLFAHL